MALSFSRAAHCRAGYMGRSQEKGGERANGIITVRFINSLLRLVQEHVPGLAKAHKPGQKTKHDDGGARRGTRVSETFRFVKNSPREFLELTAKRISYFWDGSAMNFLTPIPWYWTPASFIVMSFLVLPRCSSRTGEICMQGRCFSGQSCSIRCLII
jgi:hypothetical protein